SVLAAAERESVDKQHPVVGVDDLLVGIIDVSAPAAHALESQGVSKDMVRAASITPRTPAGEPPPAVRPISGGLQRVLTRARSLAGPDDLRVRYLLTALVDEANEDLVGAAHGLMSALPIDPDLLLRTLD